MSIKKIYTELRTQKLADKTGVPAEWADEEYVKTQTVLGKPICPIDFCLHTKQNDDGTTTKMVHILFKWEDGTKARLDTSAVSVVEVFTEIENSGEELVDGEFITLKEVTTKRGSKAIVIE